jgi:hypothetical protein
MGSPNKSTLATSCTTGHSNDDYHNDLERAKMKFMFCPETNYFMKILLCKRVLDSIERFTKADQDLLKEYKEYKEICFRLLD